MAAYLWRDTVCEAAAAHGPQMVLPHMPHQLLEPHSGLQRAGHCHALQTDFPVQHSIRIEGFAVVIICHK